MGRKTPQQTAGLDILDWLYFNQILVFSVFSQEDRKLLGQIVGDVNVAVRKTGAAGVYAEILKHYVLCILEIQLADDYDKMVEINRKLTRLDLPNADIWQRVDQHQKNFFAAEVIAIGETRECSLTKALDIAYGLLELELVCNAPASIRHRLAERCMAFEYKSAPLYFLKWLTDTQVISCKKYRETSITSNLNEYAITRIGLLCEFELARNLCGRQIGTSNPARGTLQAMKSKMSEDSRLLLLKDEYRFETQAYTSLIRNSTIFFSINQKMDPQYAVRFLRQLLPFWSRIRLFSHCTQASWLGALGAFHVEIQKSEDKDKPIYIEADNADTITNEVATLLREHGFSISDRTLYERHRKFVKESYRKVLAYYTVINKMGAVLPAHEADHYYYILLALSAKQG